MIDTTLLTDSCNLDNIAHAGKFVNKVNELASDARSDSSIVFGVYSR